jgi:hypothetical protein
MSACDGSAVCVCRQPGGQFMRLGSRIFSVLVLLAVGWCPGANACPIPVFRYALENWESTPYEVVVFRRGALTADEQAVYEALRSFGADNQGMANYSTREVDLSADVPDDDRKLWEGQALASLPRIVLRLPSAAASQGVVWSAPLTPDSARLVMDSPARREIARRIVAGDSAVWVLVEGSRKEDTEAAAATLEKQIALDQKAIQLPDGAADGVSSRVPELKIAFSAVRIARDDPAEEVFLKILQRMDPEQAAADYPVAIPVFGRGRALTAVSGDNITADSIRDCNEFMCGPCACQIKELNPGIDLLFAADWNDALAKGRLKEAAVPPLAGLAQFAAPIAAPGPGTPAPDQVSFCGNTLYRNIGIIVLATVLVVVVLSILLRTRARKTEV